MSDDQKLELGIEIVAAMKATCYTSWDIETGRIDALMETETDRMEGVTKEDWDDFTPQQKKRFKMFCES